MPNLPDPHTHMRRERHATHGPGEVCPRCDAVHLTARGDPACVGHSKTGSGKACRRDPVRGTSVCITHGAGAPQVRAAAARAVEARQAKRVLARFGEPVDTTPTEALLDTVKWTAGYVSWLRLKVQSATYDDQLTQHSNVTGKQEASVWLELLGAWNDRLVNVCAAAIRAGIEERRVRIAEQQGALVADVIRKVLDALGLTDEQQARAGEVVPAELRRLVAA